MKHYLNRIYWFVILAATALVFNSCDDEEEILPGPVVSGDAVNVTAAALITANGNVEPPLSLGISAENGLAQIEIFNPDGTTFNTYPFPANPTSTQQQFLVNAVEYTDAGQSFDYLVTASDAKGLSGSTTVTVTVEDVTASLSLLDGSGTAYLGDSLFAGTPFPFDEIDISSNYPIDSVTFFFFGQDGVPITDPESDYSPSYNTPDSEPDLFVNNATEYSETVDEDGEPILPGSISKILIRVTSATGVFFEQELRVVGTATSELQEITMGSFDNNTDGSFFSLGDSSVYDIAYTNQNSENIDFAFSNGAQSGANIFAMDDPIADEFFGNNTANWITEKETRFYSVTNDGLYDEVTVEEDIQVAYEESAPTPEISRLTNLVADDVFIIKSEEGNFYIAKVTGVTAGNDGSIQLVIKGNFVE